jgi:hypothetical protein
MPPSCPDPVPACLTVCCATPGELDAADPLAGYQDRFVIADDDLVHLDGNG